ncbi:MAG: DUF3015 family protein [Bdellovibrionota bacterium]
MINRRGLVLVIGILLTFETSHAMNMSSCSTLLNQGWFKKYQYQGVDQPLTKATKSLGSTKASTKVSTETSTASVDPGYWTKVSQSQTQATSSWGQCSLLGLKQIRENREKYFVQNKDEVLKEIASGRGEHIGVLALFSFCAESARQEFATELQRATRDFVGAGEASGAFGDIIDQTVRSTPTLSKNCFDYGS